MEPPWAGGKVCFCGFPRKIQVPACSPRAAPATGPSRGLGVLPGAVAVNPFLPRIPVPCHRFQGDQT